MATTTGQSTQPDYDFWRARFGNVVNGGEIIMTGSSTLTANGVIIGERTKGLLSIGPNAVVDLRIWVDATVPMPSRPTLAAQQDMRIGNYGPALQRFDCEPGLDGNGLVDVQGTLNANDMYFSENGGKGEIRLSGGGTVNLNGALHMSFCGRLRLPRHAAEIAHLALRSSKVSIIGSSGTFNVGLDPDPMVVDPMPASSRDLHAAFSDGDLFLHGRCGRRDANHRRR